MLYKETKKHENAFHEVFGNLSEISFSWKKVHPVPEVRR